MYSRKEFVEAILVVLLSNKMFTVFPSSDFVMSLEISILAAKL